MYDVVIVGGGAAGLSGALALGRSRRRVLVVDAGHPRNAPAGHVHNYLGREGTPPTELLAIGRDEVRGYGVEVADAAIVSARRATDDGFELDLDDGRSVRARRLLLATGLRDTLPDVLGLPARWGRDVLHCPFCHGWEVRDQRLAVLATGPMAVHQALMFRQLSPHVTLLRHTAPELRDDQAEQLAALDVAAVCGQVVAVEVEDDRLTGVRLADGQVVECDALVVAPLFTALSDVVAALGVETTETVIDGHVLGTTVPVDPNGATSVPGVWAAGNVTDFGAQVIASAAAGLRAGAMINGDLVAEDTRLAVERRRVALAS